MLEGFGLEEYWTLRPFAYHTVLRSNLPALRAARSLFAAAELRARAGHAADTTRRTSREALNLDFGRVELQDQSPLHEDNIQFESGWTLERFIEQLDARVFFWSGDARGPVNHGVRHFARYKREASIIRAPFKELYAAADPKPEFCRFNSGSPRCVNGCGSPRGSSTFMLHAQATFPAREVVEVTFRRRISLPESTTLADDPSGPWRSLWDSAGCRTEQ